MNAARLLILSSLFILSASAVSAANSFTDLRSSDVAPNIFRLGISTGWINYIEPGYISFYGPMFGLDSLVQRNYTSDFDLRFETNFSYGNIQYDGSVKDTTTQQIAPLKAGAYDYLVSFRVKPEFQFAARGSTLFFINFGMGLRYLSDRVNSSSGYQREIFYLFLPLGLRVESALSNKTILGADLEYDFFALGKVKSHLSDTNPTNPDVTNTQTSGYGIRAQVEYRFLGHLNWYSILPYFQWWNVGASDAAPYTTGLVLVEPKNSSGQAGVNFAVAF